MKKYLICALTIALPSINMLAIKPAEETPLLNAKSVKLHKSPRITQAKAATENYNTFFEGFEGRPNGFGTVYDEWLPDGWQDVSKSGETVPGYGETRHNLTWRVLDNENRQSSASVQNYSYEGEAFAYIMADVAYDGHMELTEQDEWLITPEITPKAEDWLYFKLFYRPSWTVVNFDYDHINPDYTYNYTFDGRNNQLEVYVSADNGQTWKKLWNVIDDEITGKYTEEQLEADLIDVYKQKYDPIYINLNDYIGKPIKIAFRYFGSHGHPMAIDNVAVGIPMPKPSYTIPAGFMKQGLSPYIEYPTDPTMLIPYGLQAVWTNTSEDVQTNEWSYADESGAIVTSTEKDLTTPAYNRLQTYATPSLTGFFESRASDPFQIGFKKMQAGGVLYGTDNDNHSCEFGIGFYDITDPEHRIAVSSEYIAYNPDIDLAWEKINGQEGGAYDVLGYGCMYYRTEQQYGFDYVDVAAYIKEPVDINTNIEMSVYAVDDEGFLTDLIGKATLNGGEIPYSPDQYVNMHFKFPAPVNVNSDIMVVMTGFSRVTDNIAFPFVKTRSDNTGNSFVYINTYDQYNGESNVFYNLNEFPLSDGYHFAGLLMTLGASYSWMELESQAEIDVPAEGGSAEVQIRAYHKPERWVLSYDGLTAAQNASFAAVYNETSDIYDVTITLGENALPEEIDSDIYLISPGSSVKLHAKQAGGVDGVFSDGNVKVYVDGGDFVIEGAKDSDACVYNIAGTLAAKAALSGHTVIPASHLPAGVYIISIDGEKTYKIVK